MERREELTGLGFATKGDESNNKGQWWEEIYDSTMKEFTGKKISKEVVKKAKFT